MHANRTFATEDKDLQVRFYVNDQVMGSTLTLAAGTSLLPKIKVLDPSDPNTQYQADLYYGTVQAQHSSSATDWRASDGLQEAGSRTGDGQIVFDEYLASGGPEFFYVRIRQTDRDRAWTAPVWINHPRPTPTQDAYVWSTASQAKKYHLPVCRYARRIKDSNRDTGNQPPAGYTPHNCVPSNTEEEPH